MKLVPCIEISSSIAVQVRRLALRDAHLRCSRVSQQPGAFEKSRPARAAPRVSTATSGRGRAHGNRLLVVPNAMLCPGASRATSRWQCGARFSVCVHAPPSRPRQRQLHRPAARPARGRSTQTLVFPDRYHRAPARAHPGRSPNRDARMATLPWPRVRIWAPSHIVAALKGQLAAARS